MSFRLCVLLECATPELAAEVAGQLSRDTRPVFEDDVEESGRSLYAAIETIEFPDEIEVERRRVWASWYEQDRFQFDNLRRLFQVDGVDFVAAYEIPDYADCADEGDDIEWFLVPTNGRFRRVTREVAESLLSDEIVKRLAG